MQTIFVDKIVRVIKSKKKLQERLEVNISIKEKEVTISGTPENEYLAEQVLEALDFGFPFKTALSIKEEGTMFEVIRIKDHTNRKDLSRVRARIIGTKGKTLKTLTDLTECRFELKENEVGIIGDPQLIQKAQEAVTSIIRGAKQGNVYAYLEKHPTQPIKDLGLKEKKK